MTHASVARRANGSPSFNRPAEFPDLRSPPAFSHVHSVMHPILSAILRWFRRIFASPSAAPGPSAFDSDVEHDAISRAHIRETVLDISRSSPSKHRRHRSTRWFPATLKSSLSYDALPRPTSQLDKRHTRAHTLYNMVAIVRQAIALDETDYAEEARANLSRRSEWGTIKSLSVENFDDEEDSMEAEEPTTFDRDSNTLNAARLVIQVPNQYSKLIRESFDMPDTPTSVDTLPLYVFRQSTPPYSSTSPSPSYPADKSLSCLSLQSLGKITGEMEIEMMSKRDSEMQDWSDVFSLDQYIGV